jgi:hypothetical protein
VYPLVGSRIKPDRRLKPERWRKGTGETGEVAAAEGKREGVAGLRKRDATASACGSTEQQNSAPHRIIAARSNPSAGGFQKDPGGRARPACSSAECCAGGEGPGAVARGHNQRPSDRTGGGEKQGRSARKGRSLTCGADRSERGREEGARSGWASGKGERREGEALGRRGEG